jgi:hypothetical protein
MLVLNHLARYIHRIHDSDIVGIQLNCTDIGYKIYPDGWNYLNNNRYFMQMFDQLIYAQKAYNQKYTHIMCICHYDKGILKFDCIYYSEYQVDCENPMYHKYHLQNRDHNIYTYNPNKKYFELVNQEISFTYDLDMNIIRAGLIHSRGSVHLKFKNNKLHSIKHMYIDTTVQNYVNAYYVKS